MNKWSFVLPRFKRVMLVIESSKTALEARRLNQFGRYRCVPITVRTCLWKSYNAHIYKCTSPVSLYTAYMHEQINLLKVRLEGRCHKNQCMNKIIINEGNFQFDCDNDIDILLKLSVRLKAIP